MKRIIPLIFLSLIIILPIEVNALSVEKNNLTIEKGKSETIKLSTTLEAEVTEINFTLVYTSDDVIASYNIADNLTDSTPNSSSHKIVLSTPISGTIALGTVKITAIEEPIGSSGVINIYNAKATTKGGETINLTTQSIKVTIGTPIENDETIDTTPTTETKPEEENKKQDEEKKEENKKTEDKNNNSQSQKTEETKKDEEPKEKIHLLEKIESNLVKIELKDGIYEYTIKIKEEVEELDLKPIVKDSKYKLEISNQKISELKDNQITITVKNEEEIQEYKIKVKIMKINEIKIDNSEFEATYKYKNKWIVLIVIMSITLFIGLLLTKKNK